MKQVYESIKRLNTWTPPIPRQHLYAVIVLSAFSIASMTILPHPDELFNTQTSGPLSALPVNTQADDAADANPAIKEAHPSTEFVSITDQELLGTDKQAVDGLDSDDSAQPQWVNYQVKSDDNLSVIFDTLNLPASTLQKLLSVDIQNSLVRLRIDQKLSFLVDNNNVLQELSIPVNGTQSVLFQRQGDSFTSTLTSIQQIATAEANADDTYEPTVAPDADTVKATQPKSRLVRGEINGAFVTSAKNAGLSSKHILRVVNMFRGRIDFRRDLRSGDQFKVLFDQPYSNDAKILAVSFTIKGNEIRAFRSDDGHFYDEKATSMTSGTFLRYPTNAKFRLSSQFSPNRRNPVTGRVQPHNGTDFAVPIGTPVLSTGDGVVVKATTNAATGRYVVIRHNGKYTTVYMHMSKLLVKPGQKVSQGQKIGLSGNTGRSTGPHIHYEFRINNRPVNAMRVDLPMNDQMGRDKKRSFLAKVDQYSRLLNKS